MEVARKCKISNIDKHSKVNVLAKIISKKDEINDTVIRIKDDSGECDVIFKGGISLITKDFKEDDLIIIIGNTENKGINGEIIKKIGNPKYEQLRDLEIEKQLLLGD